MVNDDYDLLLEMRKATRRHHNIANALILSKLVVVLTDKQLYGRALSAFLPVYSKLEDLLSKHKHVPVLKTVTDVTSTIPPRAEAMQQDLEHLLGPDWRDKIPKSAAAEAYADHLQQLANEDPVLLLPYAFSLYIPILLGFMAQRIQKNLQLPDDRGLAFFTIPDKGKKLSALRASVTAAGRQLTPDMRQRVVAEAIMQFKQNNAVVAEFSSGWRAVLHAVQVTAAALPSWAVAGLVAAGAAGAYAMAAAAGVVPEHLLQGHQQT